MFPRTILVADSDDDWRSICAILLRYAGFLVLEARSVSEALRLLHPRLPSAIVAGFSPWRLDGGALLQSLYRDPATAQIPVVLVTAEPSGDLHRAWAPRCAAFLVKPCALGRLLQSLHEVLGSPTQPTPPAPASLANPYDPGDRHACAPPIAGA